MRRFLFITALAIAVATVAGSTSEGATLPSASVPNGPGLVLPPNWTSPPAVPERRTYDQLLALWRQAGAAYAVPWQVLAAINKIESDFGRNMGPSSANALGWMQFIPDTWLRWGTDGNGDGVASPWNPEDGVYSAARYLAAAGAATDLPRAIFAYNHAQWYVDDVLALTRLFGEDGAGFGAGLDTSLFGPGLTGSAGSKLVFRIDDIAERIDKARKRVTRARQALVEVELEAERLDWRILAAEEKAGNPGLTDRQFEGLEETVTRLSVDRDAVAVRVGRLQARLDYEVTRLDELRKEAATTENVVTFTRPMAGAFGGPIALGDYVFPVGGGAGVVSLSHTHHDYPAADIAAPEGSPVFALADSVVVDAWPSPSGRCGIGFQLRAADGHDYVYCHLAYLEAGIVPGAALSAGAPVGIVGLTGNTTGPHLHLQYAPTTSYPQAEAWFQAFAGRAFTWQDGESANSDAASGGPVFEVVDSETVTFTR
jgi:murein DD-endopeptidase MepM/ murein hydrolase activator NlpD